MIEKIILNFLKNNFSELNPRCDGHIIHVDNANIYCYNLEGLIKIRAGYNHYQPIDVTFDNPKFFDIIREAMICQSNMNKNLIYDKSSPK